MKIKKTLISMVMALATMATCLSTSAFAENVTEIDNYISENNYVATMEEYDKYHVGDVVTFEDGMQFVVWSREMLPDEDIPNNYYVLTKYVEYVPNQEIDFNCDDILDAVPLSNSGITSYFSASRTETFSNGRTVAATVLARFMYDGVNCPSVYSADYRFSDGSVLTYENMYSKTSNLFKTCSETLVYTWRTVTTDHKGREVSVTCKKDGTQG